MVRIGSIVLKLLAKGGTFFERTVPINRLNVILKYSIHPIIYTFVTQAGHLIALESSLVLRLRCAPGFDSDNSHKRNFESPYERCRLKYRFFPPSKIHI